MPKFKRVLAIIPARGGSKRLPRKNILSFAGQPLLAWTIEQARGSTVIDRVVVSTDDSAIAGVAKEWSAEVIQRPAQLATDMAATFDVIIHALDTLKAAGYEPELVVLLQPTSPLRESADIDEAVAYSREHEGTTVISVCELQHPAAAWSFVTGDDHLLTPLLGWDVLTKRSQDVPKLYVPNGALYVFSPVTLYARGRILGPPLLPYVMPVERSIDIDTQEEFNTAEQRLLVQGQ